MTDLHAWQLPAKSSSALVGAKIPFSLPRTQFTGHSGLTVYRAVTLLDDIRTWCRTKRYPRSHLEVTKITAPEADTLHIFVLDRCRTQRPPLPRNQNVTYDKEMLQGWVLKSTSRWVWEYSLFSDATPSSTACRTSVDSPIQLPIARVAPNDTASWPGPRRAAYRAVFLWRYPYTDHDVRW